MSVNSHYGMSNNERHTVLTYVDFVRFFFRPGLATILCFPLLPVPVRLSQTSMSQVAKERGCVVECGDGFIEFKGSRNARNGPDR